ncbi:MAG: hypothetical protein HZA54_17105 [Planctomycetes bacterium]|nr:hypothetical protein [Planctomycetota bacterium]
MMSRGALGIPALRAPPASSESLVATPETPSAESAAPAPGPFPRRVWRSGWSELWLEGPGEWLLRTNGARAVAGFALHLALALGALALLAWSVLPGPGWNTICWAPFALLLFALAGPLNLARRLWHGRPIARILEAEGVLRLHLLAPTPLADAVSYLELPLTAFVAIEVQDNSPPPGQTPPARFIPNAWLALALPGGKVFRLGFTEEKGAVARLEEAVKAGRPRAAPCQVIALSEQESPESVGARLDAAGFARARAPERRCLATPYTMDFQRAAWSATDGTRVEYLKWPTEAPFLVVDGPGTARAAASVQGDAAASAGGGVVRGGGTDGVSPSA